MSDQIPYLSDEELQKLMADAERDTAVKAPDDLEEKVIARIESREKKKTVEFARYCVRVAFGVAAAIALLCIVPNLPKATFMKPVAEPVLIEKEIPTRDQVIGDRKIPTREEALAGVNEPSLIDELKSYFD